MTVQILRQQSGGFMRMNAAVSTTNAVLLRAYFPLKTKDEFIEFNKNLIKR